VVGKRLVENTLGLTGLPVAHLGVGQMPLSDGAPNQEGGEDQGQPPKYDQPAVAGTPPAGPRRQVGTG
jgi:hypothetical protein